MNDYESKNLWDLFTQIQHREDGSYVVQLSLRHHNARWTGELPPLGPFPDVEKAVDACNDWVDEWTILNRPGAG